MKARRMATAKVAIVNGHYSPAYRCIVLAPYFISGVQYVARGIVTTEVFYALFGERSYND